MKKSVIGILISCLVFSSAACGQAHSGETDVPTVTNVQEHEEESGEEDPAQESADTDGSAEDIIDANTVENGVLDSIGKLIKASGRDFDELFTARPGETLESSFFSFTVTDIASAEKLDGYNPGTEGRKFVTAHVSVTNTYGQDIPVGNYDFSVFYDTGEEMSEEDRWAYSAFMDGMYPDEATLEPGQTLEGMIVFDIPADVTDFVIAYQETFEDEFVGNTYAVECTLQEQPEQE